ncbi:MAG: ComEC/Rec2 family competence protein [Marinifilaceae bacterium]|nr:ComEC/Rec2 family competence protein [Marinifilaceae bacterium]
MINFARRYPFILFTIPLVTGIGIGNSIVMSYTETAIFLLILLLFIIILYRLSSLSVKEYAIPLLLIAIGVAVSNINLREIITFPGLIENHILPFIEKFRTALIKKNQRIISAPEISALSNAIALGYKNDLPPQIKELFAKCGIMHIAAVSGLHVGAIFVLIKKGTSLIKGGFIYSKGSAITATWIYTILSGLSPSAIRAAAILTYTTIGESFNRSFSSLNGIFACFFITIIISPDTLYNLSFQLSYAAYIGIITLFPLFSPAKKGGNRIVKWIVASLSVSVAAQLLTLPITIYYFNAISTNSFILNLAVIPLVSLLLYIDIIALLLPSPLSCFLGEATRVTGRCIIDITELIEPINIYVQDIYISNEGIIIYYITLLGATIFIHKFLHHKTP